MTPDDALRDAVGAGEAWAVPDGAAPAATAIATPDAMLFHRLADGALRRGRLTNNGPLAVEFEKRLADALEVEHLVLTSSGTLALQVAFRALGLAGSVVTTPFTWVTTASALVWTGLRPLYADIDPHSWHLDPARAEAAIAPDSSAILAVHVYGDAADVDGLAALAGRRGLKLVYDAAHAFGARVHGRGVLSYGDAAAISLNATKLAHAAEGGAVAFRDAEACARARALVNNGLAPDGSILCAGINGRMSELHAAVGLAMLARAGATLAARRAAAERLLGLIAGSAVGLQRPHPAGSRNHAYFPVAFRDRVARDGAATALMALGLAPRTYFDAPLNRAPGVGDGSSAPVAESLATRMLCLPLRHGADATETARIAAVVRDVAGAVTP